MAVIAVMILCSTEFILQGEGPCMLPTIPNKAIIVYSHNTDDLHEGQIVIAEVDAYGDGNIYIIIKRIAFIDENGIYLLGDNTSNSQDSRYFGYIQHSQVIGVVLNY